MVQKLKTRVNKMILRLRQCYYKYVYVYKNVLKLTYRNKKE